MIWLEISLVAFFAATVAHCVFTRLPGPLNSVSRFLVVGGLVGLALIGMLWRLQVPTISAVAGILLYAFLCELYIFMFTFVIGSLSVGILMELLTTGAALRPDPEAGSEMTRRRLVTLERNGFLANIRGALVLTRKGRTTVFLYRSLRAFFRHDAA
jgi:hypothetical protein